VECESTKSTLRWVVSRKKLDQAAINCRPFILPASVRAHLAAQAPVAAQDTSSSVISNRWQQTPGLKTDRGNQGARIQLPAALSGNIASAARRIGGESGGNVAAPTEPEQDANQAQGGNIASQAAAGEPPSGNIATRVDAGLALDFDPQNATVHALSGRTSTAVHAAGGSSST